MPDRPHPDFLAAPEAQRWTAPLAGLRRKLFAEAMKHPTRWAYRILRHGACVAMRIDKRARAEIRISRREAPADDAACQRWRQEVAVFRRHLGIEGWIEWDGDDDLVEVSRASTGAVALFSEPAMTGAVGAQIGFFGPPERRQPSALEEGR